MIICLTLENYTLYMFLEVLRLYPPGVGTARETATDDLELKLSGYVIPKGTMISISYFVSNHNPGHWEDPETFDPSRFSPDREK